MAENNAQNCTQCDDPTVDGCPLCPECEPASIGLTEIQKEQVCNLIAEKAGTGGGTGGNITEADGVYTWIGSDGSVVIWSSGGGGGGGLTEQQIKAIAQTCVDNHLVTTDHTHTVDTDTFGMITESNGVYIWVPPGGGAPVTWTAGGGGGDGLTEAQVKAIAQTCVDAHLSADDHTPDTDTFGTVTLANGVYTWTPADGGDTITWMSGGAVTGITAEEAKAIALTCVNDHLANVDHEHTVDTDTFGTLTESNGVYTWVPAGGGTPVSWVSGGGGGLTEAQVKTIAQTCVDNHLLTEEHDHTDTFGTITLNNGVYTWTPADGGAVIMWTDGITTAEEVAQLICDADKVPADADEPIYAFQVQNGQCVVVEIEACDCTPVVTDPCDTDTTAPQLLSFTPANNSTTTFPTIPSVMFTLNEQIASTGCLYLTVDGSTANIGNFQEVDNGNGTWSYIHVGSPPLAVNSYNAGIADCLADACGNVTTEAGTVTNFTIEGAALDCIECYTDQQTNSVRVDWGEFNFNNPFPQTVNNWSGTGVSATLNVIGNPTMANNPVSQSLNYNSTVLGEGFQLTFDQEVCGLASYSFIVPDGDQWDISSDGILNSQEAVSGSASTVLITGNGTAANSIDATGPDNLALAVTSFENVNTLTIEPERFGNKNIGLYIDSSCEPTYWCEQPAGTYTDQNGNVTNTLGGEWLVGGDCA